MQWLPMKPDPPVTRTTLIAASDFAVGIGPTRHMDALRMNTSAAQKTKRPPAGGLPVIS